MAKKKQFNYNKAMLIVGIIIAILLVALLIKSLVPTGRVTYYDQEIFKEKETCPYECCIGEIYLTRDCNLGYDCRNNVCMAIDSDGDGLSDIEERNIGTNPQLFDTDGDTLSDYQEYVNLGTNPLNKNTDGDRYNDNEDRNPLKVNTAEIEIQIISQKIEPNIQNIGLILITGGSAALLDFEMELYSTEVVVGFSNIGSDYSSYLKYDVELKIGEEIIDRKRVNFGRVNAGSVLSEYVSFSTTIGDVPSQVFNLIIQQSEPRVVIRNVDYERFS